MKPCSNAIRQKLGGWPPRPSQCWPVPVPGAQCARTNSWLRRDDWRERPMTVHCSMCCPRWSTSSRPPTRSPSYPVWRSAPTGGASPPAMGTRRCGVGRRHRPADRRAADRPHRPGAECGVQPRRAAHPHGDNQTQTLPDHLSDNNIHAQRKHRKVLRQLAFRFHSGFRQRQAR